MRLLPLRIHDKTGGFDPAVLASSQPGSLYPAYLNPFCSSNQEMWFSFPLLKSPLSVKKEWLTHCYHLYPKPSMQPGNRRVLSVLYLEALEKRSILMLKALANVLINCNKALYFPPSLFHLFAHYFIISYANYLIASLQLIYLKKKQNSGFLVFFCLSFSEPSLLRRVSVSCKEEFRCLSLSYSWRCTAARNPSLCAVHQTQAQPSFNISTNKSVIL